MDNKILWIDLETGGLNAKESSITQISGLVSINGKVVEQFNIMVRPNPTLETSMEALKVQGKTFEDFKKSEYVDENVAYSKLIKVLDKYVNKYDKNDKYILGGYNVKFDIDFINELFKRYNNHYLFSYIKSGYLDPMYLITTLQLIKKLPILQNNKLETWAKYFNVPLQAHDSMSDIIATRYVWIKMAGMISGDARTIKYDKSIGK